MRGDGKRTGLLHWKVYSVFLNLYITSNWVSQREREKTRADISCCVYLRCFQLFHKHMWHLNFQPRFCSQAEYTSTDLRWSSSTSAQNYRLHNSKFMIINHYLWKAIILQYECCWCLMIAMINCISSVKKPLSQQCVWGKSTNVC